ncbi:hypothetical protein DPMN_036523 [Dreissena polymorpha]|uniref:Uncharacterized protein n=1 Tax=Dreissena polymorpha TaxID=45954 RepID=A0A9D4MBN8_DREPO|nr:hypothetical protein DPMN_036523 [Dreissena polymorpha]
MRAHGQRFLQVNSSILRPNKVVLIGTIIGTKCIPTNGVSNEVTVPINCRYAQHFTSECPGFWDGLAIIGELENWRVQIAPDIDYHIREVLVVWIGRVVAFNTELNRNIQ